jgi:hypothetical protein
MTQYLLSVHHRDDELAAAQAAMSEAEMAEIYGAVDAFNRGLQESGSWVFAGGLHPLDSATVVSSVGGKVAMTDGPFIEAKEHLGGFWVIEAADLDAALATAAAASEACRAPVEVRPFQDVEEER